MDRTQQLEKLRDIILEWNEKINVTAIRDPKEFDRKNVQDSLAILIEQDLEMSVDLAGNTEVSAGYAALDLGAFHQHELAGDVLLVVYSLLAEGFRDFHGIKGI